MKRQQPLPRRRKKARAYKTPRCKTLRCGKPAKVADWCHTHALREADRLAREVVRARDLQCRALDDGHTCQGGLQWAHVHSRSYKAIRHVPENAVMICAARHAYFTHRPLEWQQWCLDHDIPWDELRHEALNGAASWSLADTLEKLTGGGA